MQQRFDAVVIGAGVAGLYAAQQLAKHGIRNVCVIEAQENIGGRVKQIHGVAPWPLELGPEFIHGVKSIVVDACTDVGMKLNEVLWPDHVYWGDEKRLFRVGDQEDAEFEEVDKLMFDEVSCAVARVGLSLLVVQSMSYMKFRYRYVSKSTHAY